ncbi:MAG TPA: carboxypeptidase-like regulatory domain-containing protein, partial [Chitinophaga sp.]
MKRFIPISTFLLLAMLFQAACKKTDAPSIPPINVIVKVSYDSTNGGYAFPLTGISVTVKNTVTGTTTSRKTDDTGLGIFNSISAGIYDVQATMAISKATYENVTGTTIDKDSMVFNAALSNLTLNATTNNTLTLKLQLGKIGDWVIKQIYYAGSNTQNGALFRDQFIEIYNNSNEVLYADSLYIAQLAGNNTGTDKTDLTKGYFLSDVSDALYKQFDWSKSLGISPASDAANRNFVYAKTMFRVPGNGRQYPIQPGASFVIAATAQNHQAPFVGTDGK